MLISSINARLVVLFSEIDPEWIKAWQGEYTRFEILNIFSFTFNHECLEVIWLLICRCLPTDVPKKNFVHVVVTIFKTWASRYILWLPFNPIISEIVPGPEFHIPETNEFIGESVTLSCLPLHQQISILKYLLELKFTVSWWENLDVFSFFCLLVN